MGKVVLDITMSLDGFIAGTDINAKQPMGYGGLRLHDWIFNGKTDIDQQILNESMETYGAVITGRHTYNVAIEEAWEGVSPFTVPALVLSKSVPQTIVDGFTFITTGIESALVEAKAIAGNKDIWVMGGADIAQQYIKAGLLDELNIHLTHVLLGDGLRLFDHTGAAHIELERTKLIASPGVTHITFRVVK